MDSFKQLTSHFNHDLMILLVFTDPASNGFVFLFKPEVFSPVLILNPFVVRVDPAYFVVPGFNPIIIYVLSVETFQSTFIVCHKLISEFPCSVNFF